MNYVHFCKEDRDWAMCEIVWTAEEAELEQKRTGHKFEPFFNIQTRGWDYAECKTIFEFLKGKSIVADRDEYSGEIHILVERNSGVD